MEDGSIGLLVKERVFKLIIIHDVNDAILCADEVWLLRGMAPKTRYGSYEVWLLKDGKVLDSGPPRGVLKTSWLADIYGIELTRFVSSDGSMMLGIPTPVDFS